MSWSPKWRFASLCWPISPKNKQIYSVYSYKSSKYTQLKSWKQVILTKIIILLNRKLPKWHLLSTQRLKCEDLMFFSVSYYCKLNIFGAWSDKNKQFEDKFNCDGHHSLFPDILRLNNEFIDHKINSCYHCRQLCKSENQQSRKNWSWVILI